MPNEGLPVEIEGLQLNFCKTLACDNFGLSDAKHYILQHTNPHRPTMICRDCGAFPPLLNNLEVLNELRRLRNQHSDGLPTCKNESCHNCGLAVQNHQHLYQSFGFSGDRQRYRCKSCHTTFVDKWSGENKKVSFQEALLGLLFTGYSVREICRKLQINPKTFYDHLKQISSRCRRKLAEFDTRWMHGSTSYELASHFQALQPNSKNGVLWIATGEANSGYILCQHINYSSDITPPLESKHDPYKDNARLLPTNFTPIQKGIVKKPGTKYSSERHHESEHHFERIHERIDARYKAILERNNVEDPMEEFDQLHYPTKGTLIRPQYTSHAHYLHILDWCDDKNRVSLYLPQDPLLRSAAISVNLNRIKQQNIDLLYVEEDKDWQDTQAIKKIDIARMGWWRDRWAIANQKNAAKGICYLAGDNFAPEFWLKQATLKKTQFYQDRFQLLFSSFINEPRRKFRPAGILPLLDIFRAWHNLCYQDKNGLTAAQHLKLADHPLTLCELLK
ncbi:lactate dehydrogenase [Vibrio sp. S4M6]|uniref:lactate dehydrogenase n=1 Tax=Vibrio sinus TaxID=2946865 RepID=UPI00202A9013|nr:lactate dehydrogenase [Vibrio sinus]